mmetsp:Transcript_85492/g.242384  ORF Transcript_85492/g.242384 Transcript_85492/m.242384 type:complete len:318 (-) Transcript_85492:161-1114(-)
MDTSCKAETGSSIVQRHPTSSAKLRAKGRMPPMHREKWQSPVAPVRSAELRLYPQLRPGLSSSTQDHDVQEQVPRHHLAELVRAAVDPVDLDDVVAPPHLLVPVGPVPVADRPVGQHAADQQRALPILRGREVNDVQAELGRSLALLNVDPPLDGRANNGAALLLRGQPAAAAQRRTGAGAEPADGAARRHGGGPRELFAGVRAQLQLLRVPALPRPCGQRRPPPRRRRVRLGSRPLLVLLHERQGQARRGEARAQQGGQRAAVGRPGGGPSLRLLPLCRLRQRVDLRGPHRLGPQGLLVAPCLPFVRAVDHRFARL